MEDRLPLAVQRLVARAARGVTARDERHRSFYAQGQSGVDWVERCQPATVCFRTLRGKEKADQQRSATGRKRRRAQPIERLDRQLVEPADDELGSR